MYPDFERTRYYVLILEARLEVHQKMWGRTDTTEDEDAVLPRDKWAIGR